jgi:hypothetical protein
MGKSLALSFSILFVFLSSAFAFTEISNYSHDASPAEIQKAIEDNQNYHSKAEVRTTPVPYRPVEDTAQMSYVLMSADAPTSEVLYLRKTIAQNLPAGVKLVLLTDSGSEGEVRQQYSKWISADRLLIVSDTDTGNGFWARDSFPYPVYNSQKKDVALIGAQYYRQFDSGKAIADGVKASIYRPESFTFVGGNLLSDEDGHCFSVNSYRLFTITAEDLKSAYGCKTVQMMEHVSGIGDADEVLKPLSGHRMITNSLKYKPQLESLGYQVILLPSVPDTYRTYVNSLIVRGTVFMPSYGLPSDKEAAAVYEKLGYKVVPIPSNNLSDEMHGSIHCQTMAYPPISEQALIRALKAR